MPHGIDVYVKDHDCCDHIEKLYYSCGFDVICIHCGEYLPDPSDADDAYYPQCIQCNEDKIAKRPTAITA